MKVNCYRVLKLRYTVLVNVFILGIVVFGLDGRNNLVLSQASSILEDFRQLNDEFPAGWNGSRSLVTAKESYIVYEEDGQAFLKGKGANQRVYTKQILWNPKTHPILKWRWRVHSIPENADFVAAVFANLDTDLMFIPVSTKYVWSIQQNKGLITDGGFFGAAEMVIRTGTQAIGVWVEEEVNAYEDFKEIHGHDPAPQAWGISLQSGPGVEIDFGAIEILRTAN